MYHFAFILEQTLGHITHALNLRNYVSCDPEVNAEWGLPAWRKEGLAAKVPLYRSNWTLQAGLHTRKFLSQLDRGPRLDGLFFHTQVTAVLSPDWLRRIPSIVSLDATPVQYDRLGAFYQHAAGPAWLEKWKWRLNRNCFRQARRIVAWSDWARQGLLEEYGVPPEKVAVIPPGVDTAAWAGPFREKRPADPVRILFVGGDFERKGGKVLLDAFRRLRVQGPDMQGGREQAPIELHLVTRESIPPEPGVFLYQEMQPNSRSLKDLFFRSDIFCLPTLGDCLPMALSEAGAARLPLVSTRVAAIPEIVRDGETGFLIDAGDGQQLAASLRRLILNPDLRLLLGNNAGQLVEEQYDAGKNASRLLDLMKEISICNGRNRASQ